MPSVFVISFLFIANIYGIGAETKCDGPPPNDVGKFLKVSAISKYFYFDSQVENPFSYTRETASEMCRDNGLEMAEITSFTDLKSLKGFVSDLKSRFWLGLNDEGHEGEFVEGDGSTKIKYQAFSAGNPDNGDGDEDCVQIKYAKDQLFMDDVSCESTAGVLCQFPKGSYCSINSYQENVDIQEEVVPLGASTNYLVSTVQKTKYDAYATCLTKNKYLLVLNNNEWILELVREMKFYQALKGLNPETTFWTSGRIEQDNLMEFTGDIEWEVLNEKYSYEWNPKNIDFQWGPGEPRPKTGGFRTDCLDVSFEMLNGPIHPIWRAANCELPKYFICMDLNITVPFIPDDLDSNEVEDNNDTQPICSKKPAALKTVSPPAINLLTPLSVDQTLDLMLFVLKNDLQSGTTKIKESSGISWKREILEIIFNIFKQSVSSDYVPHGFLNVVQEVSMIYQNGIKGADKSVNPKGWETIKAVLSKCLETDVEEMPFVAYGMKIKYFNDSTPELLTVPQEHADLYTNLDIVLDALWYVFSFSLGTCYHTAKRDSSNWASQFYILFSLDFIEKLEDKWAVQDDTNVLKQSLILGNFDVFTTMDNLRSATTAAYLRNRIMDREVVRPISLDKLKGGKTSTGYQMENFKTGAEFN